jgi:carbonic anhydrase/acetyltransferase-like protein (isoleucine patch superfamily)
MRDKLNFLPYAGTRPALAGPPARFERGAAVIGRVTLGADAWLSESTVIRADGHFVRVGRELMLGPRATVHIAHDVYPTLIGERVTVGEYAVVHACTVGDGCVIEDGAVILDGAELEADSLLRVGSVVFPRTKLAGGFIYSGRPAKPERPLAHGELAERRDRLRGHIQATDVAPPRDDARRDFDSTVFIANTATLHGKIVAAPEAQVYYACDLDAGSGEIVIGARSNVQDNSLLRTGGGRIVIGVDSTIGHNVKLAACTIGDRSLIGIGSVVAAGTVVADDVFLAAGAATAPGQVLEGGMWVGSPARRIGDLDDAKRKIISDTIPTYCEYARELARVQAAAALAAA